MPDDHGHNSNGEIPDSVDAPELAEENLLKEARFAEIEKFLIHEFRNKPFTYGEAEAKFNAQTHWTWKHQPEELKATIDYFHELGVIEFDEAAQTYRQNI